ncbi:MAG: hypothetical protein FJ030_18750 [Chloroflexi bacterium]|nr:hypothetical protein [Chloroflexota bacterium]
MIIRNNAVSQNLTFQIAVAVDVPPANVQVDHNLIDGYRGYEDEVYGEDYVEGDPLFEDPASRNFHLHHPDLAIALSHPPLRIARHTFSGVSGKSRRRAPTA